MESKFFKIQELVSKQVYEKHRDMAWDFFDPRLISIIDFLKEKYNWTITINDWSWGGKFQQRGFRANIDGLVKNKTINGQLYCSPHMRGQAVDFDVKNMTSQEVRDQLEKDKSFLPCNIRLEDGVNWVHLDVVDRNRKIYLFKI